MSNFNKYLLGWPVELLALASSQNTVLYSPSLRNSQPNRPAMVRVIDALGANMGEDVVFISAHHGAPWVRQDKIVNGIIIAPPKNIVSGAEMADYITQFKDPFTLLIPVNVIVPTIDYNQTNWKK